MDTFTNFPLFFEDSSSSSAVLASAIPCRSETDIPSSLPVDSDTFWPYQNMCVVA
ncbi:hypothetical protein K474DRAFT_1660480 [Panus rudis PR-1116 ss-1]|nr:hypothetical protein K474DRAFT_1660480 [Panus rudis PR-1116 ss-1]